MTCICCQILQAFGKCSSFAHGNGMKWYCSKVFHWNFYCSKVFFGVQNRSLAWAIIRIYIYIYPFCPALSHAIVADFVSRTT